MVLPPIGSPPILEARGDVPRNNIVDATNYVLHELGHPVHAFDLDKLEGGEINIRYAQTGETMLPLGADAKGDRTFS